MANRPAVLVYQEFATLSFPSTTPELSACIVGPAYQIVDYPEDRSTLASDGFETVNYAKLLVGGTVAEYGGAKDAFFTGPATAVDLAYTGLITNASVDTASVKVYAEEVRGHVFTSAPTVDMLINTASIPLGVDAVASGVKVGDWAIIDTGAGILVKRVRGFGNTGGTNFEVMVTSMFSAALTNVTVEFQRDLANVELPAIDYTAISSKVTVLGALNLSGLPVAHAKLLVSYRALRTDLNFVSAPTQIVVDSKGNVGEFGKFDARNPLAVGLVVAAANTTSPLQAFGVSTDNSVGYAAAKVALSSHKSVYAAALLSGEAADVKGFADAFAQAADPDYAVLNGVPQRFKVALGYAGPVSTTRVLVATTAKPAGTPVGGAGANSTFTDATATFVDSGARVGDLLRITSDVGAVQSFTISDVVANERVVFDIGAGAIPGAYTYEIVRDITADKEAQADSLVALVHSVANKRAVLCWPDQVLVTSLVDGSKARLSSGAKAPAGYQTGAYLACAVAGMTTALPSHQGFTNFAVNGIKGLLHSTPYFTDKQITKISNAGLFVFQQDDASSLPYILHELTTDVSTLQFGEFMCVKNMDFVSMEFKDVLDDFLGKWNITTETMDFIRSALQARLDSILLDKRVRIGARVKSGKITLLQESKVSADRIEVYFEGKFPMVLNTVGLHVVSG
jgi:hypothetical protein